MAAVLYEPLHHKYRPQTFSQLVGQSAIASTLTHALEQNKIAPAYLFCGPRGTGKTSSARILAKSLNCLNADGPTPKPCGKCDLCLSVSRGNALDIVEIDAASNTGVDNIRELIERAQFAPVQCRYKAYVIDECHMLSVAAFNALLKTLEEPPERVVFVLATTDPQRVLPTIISRCQRFDFRRIPLPAMIRHLSYIAKKEEINIAESALQLVAQISQGGLRDAESLLDQLSLQTDEITVETVWDLVGAVPERDLLNLVRAIAADDSTVLIDRVRNLMDKGREPLIVLQSLVGFYRDLLIAKTAPKREDLVAITPSTWVEMTAFAQKLSASQILASQQRLQAAEVQVKNTTQPRLWLEITLTSLLPSALGAAALNEDSASVSVGTVSSQPVTVVAQKPTAQVERKSVPMMEDTASARSVPEKTRSEIARSEITRSKTTAKKTEVEKAEVEKAEAEKAEVETLRTDKLTSIAATANSASPSAPEQRLSKPSAIDPTESSASDGGSEPSEADVGSASSTSDLAFGSLADLWQKILAALEPRGTQMLMNQQGILLGFDGVSARVGFKSASLQKMARDRVPNLEKALASVFNRPIKVSLEVVAAEESQSNQAKGSSSTPTQNPSPPSASPANGSFDRSSSNHLPPEAASDNRSDSATQSALEKTRSSQAFGTKSNKRNTDRDNSDVLNQPPASTPHRDRQAPSAKPVDHLPSAPSSAAPGQWQTNQEQENIKRFAQFFNGQIVDLDDDLDASEANQAQKKKLSSEPGPDVPF